MQYNNQRGFLLDVNHKKHEFKTGRLAGYGLSPEHLQADQDLRRHRQPLSASYERFLLHGNDQLPLLVILPEPHACLARQRILLVLQ